jgi:signal transduction histidine kinase
LQRLENSFAELKRFAGDASHELRTPVTALRTVGETALRDGQSPETLRDAIGSMLEEAQRISDLINALLLLARADSGTVPVTRESVQMGQLLGDVRESLLVLAEERQQRIEIEAGENVTAQADRTLLRQALINLVHNAIIYSPASRAIRLRCYHRKSEVILEVADEGPGIAHEHRDKIFERFYRIDKARSHRHGGAGLGLAIARWAVERQAGRIELNTELGKGSVFRIAMSRQ